MAKKKAPARTPAAKTTRARTKKSPFDVYQAVTDTILDLLDQGTVPWHNPIRGAGGGWPKNLTSGKRYRGVNVFLLAMTALSKGYESDWWVTFRQAKERGGSVKKGERSTMVVFWKKLDPTTKADPDKRPGEVSADEPKERFVLRYYNVFNAAAQCEGLEVPDGPKVEPVDFQPLESAEQIVKGYANPPAIEHGGRQAKYAVREDRVSIPVPERFETGEDYYATLFHELIHSTGIEKRLNRGLDTNPKPFGSPEYTKEELVAEMGAAFLNAVAGIGPQTIASSASYIDGWRKKLKGDKKLVVHAAGQAQRAADHILGVTWDTDENPIPTTTTPTTAGTTPATADTKAGTGTTDAEPKASARSPSQPPPRASAPIPSRRWDFKTTFPPPLPEAVEAGNLVPEDADGENLKALTLQHALDCRTMLEKEKLLLDAANRDVYPETGRTPRTQKAKEKNERETLQRLDLCRRRYDALIRSYADSFGVAAAAAFQAHVEDRPLPEPRRDTQPAEKPELSAEERALSAKGVEAICRHPRPGDAAGPQLTLWG